MKVRRDFGDPDLVRKLETLPEGEIASALLDADDPELEAAIARSVEAGKRDHDPEDGMSADEFLEARRRGDL